MEAVQKLKANLKLDNKPCGWCKQPLHIGDEAAVCTACQQEHHDRCWEDKAGCATTSCVNAPLARLDAPAAGAPAAATGSPFPAGLGAVYSTLSPVGTLRCPQCAAAIPVGSDLCPVCRAITSPDGIYRGPKTTAPGATASLVCGIIGIFFCGLIFGIIAITKSNEAKRAIAGDPSYGGGGLATAGFVLGVLGLIGWGIIIVARISAMH